MAHSVLLFFCELSEGLIIPVGYQTADRIQNHFLPLQPRLFFRYIRLLPRWSLRPETSALLRIRTWPFSRLPPDSSEASEAFRYSYDHRSLFRRTWPNIRRARRQIIHHQTRVVGYGDLTCNFHYLTGLLIGIFFKSLSVFFYLERRYSASSLDTTFIPNLSMIA